MKIVVLEKIDMTEEQVAKLERLGEVQWFTNSNEGQTKERIKDADVVIVDWVDPSSFILSMKSPSLLSLMSTGYDWIQHRDEAKAKNILISNVPGYATEAVAEHIIGLALSAARKSMIGDRNVRSGNKEKGYLQGIELKGRRIGVIGLGQIGKRVADISKCLGMEVVTYNRHSKNVAGITDLPLEKLLSSSDVICISCPLNNDSREMLNRERLKLLKEGAIIVSTTWGVLVIEDVVSFVQDGKIRGIGLDAAIEGGKLDLPKKLLELDNVIITPHVGFNTIEAKMRQVDICISNIASFINGKPENIAN